MLTQEDFYDSFAESEFSTDEQDYNESNSLDSKMVDDSLTNLLNESRQSTDKSATIAPNIGLNYYKSTSTESTFLAAEGEVNSEPQFYRRSTEEEQGEATEPQRRPSTPRVTQRPRTTSERTLAVMDTSRGKDDDKISTTREMAKPKKGRRSKNIEQAISLTMAGLKRVGVKRLSVARDTLPKNAARQKR